MLEQELVDYCFIYGKYGTLSFYKKNWVIFGNLLSFSCKDKKSVNAKLGLIQHGIGAKSCNYDVSVYPFDVHFVEGEFRLKRLKKIFPNFVYECIRGDAVQRCFAIALNLHCHIDRLYSIIISD